MTLSYSTAQHSTAQHSTAQHSTAQHSTAQHSTAQHSTAQHSTAQHSTAQHNNISYWTNSKDNFLFFSTHTVADYLAHYLNKQTTLRSIGEIPKHLRKIFLDVKSRHIIDHLLFYIIHSKSTLISYLPPKEKKTNYPSISYHYKNKIEFIEKNKEIISLTNIYGEKIELSFLSKCLIQHLNGNNSIEDLTHIIQQEEPKKILDIISNENYTLNQDILRNNIIIELDKMRFNGYLND